MLRRYTRALVVENGWRSGSDLEDKVAWLLHRFGARPDVVRQQYVVDRYRLDFAWPDVRVALEVDGWHHRSPEGAAHDALRDAVLRDHGWIVLRVDDRHGEESLEIQVSNAISAINRLRAPHAHHGESAHERRAESERRAATVVEESSYWPCQCRRQDRNCKRCNDSLEAGAP